MKVASELMSYLVNDKHFSLYSVCELHKPCATAPRCSLELAKRFVNFDDVKTAYCKEHQMISCASVDGLFILNSATVSINRLSDSKLSLWCLGALFDCCISRDKPFHPLTPPSDLRQYAVENRQEIRISQSLY